METDIKHLRTAGVLHYIFAGINAVIFFLVAIYIFLAEWLTTVSGAQLFLKFISSDTAGVFTTLEKTGAGAMMFQAGAVGIGSIVELFLLAGIVTNFYCGTYLREQRNYLFCLIVTALTIASFPFGTIVGIYTLVMLLKDPVKDLFKKNAEAAPFEKNPPKISLLSKSFIGYGVFSFFGTAFVLLHLVAAVMFQTGTGGEAVESYSLQMNAFVIAVAAVIFVAGVVFSVITIAAGVFLKKRKNYIFCFAAAVLNSVFLPFGTILGLYGIHTLMRDSVKNEFRERRQGDLR